MAKSLPPHIADKLLDRLGSDDDFRAYFQKDARGALSFLGYDEPAGTPSNDSAIACMRCESMPDKKAFTQSRDAYRKQLTSQAMQVIFKL
jgi:putative modified peptide